MREMARQLIATYVLTMVKIRSWHVLRHSDNKQYPHPTYKKDRNYDPSIHYYKLSNNITRENFRCLLKHPQERVYQLRRD